jgi:hypothetical protein
MAIAGDAPLTFWPVSDRFVALCGVQGGTLPLQSAIFIDVSLAFICKQKTYLLSVHGPSVALLESEAARNHLANIASRKRSSHQLNTGSSSRKEI